ncbi:MAG: hypothetical protein AAB390_05120 [Patescibacteria group bacterium]
MKKTEAGTPGGIIGGLNAEPSTANIDIEATGTDAGAIAEKWLARIPEADREIEWTPAQIKALLYVLSSAVDRASGSLFATNDKLGNLPKSVFRALYDNDDEPNRQEVVGGIKEFVADPIAGAIGMDKIILIEESGLPESVVTAMKSIILCEGERPMTEVYAELVEEIARAEEGSDIIDILKNGSIRVELNSPEARKRDDTRRSAARILLSRLWPEFTDSAEVVFFIKIDQLSLPEELKEANRAVDDLKIKFLEIFQEEFVPSESLKTQLEYFGENANIAILVLGDMVERAEELIVKEWGNS